MKIFFLYVLRVLACIALPIGIALLFFGSFFLILHGMVVYDTIVDAVSGFGLSLASIPTILFLNPVRPARNLSQFVGNESRSDPNFILLSLLIFMGLILFSLFLFGAYLFTIFTGGCGQI